MDWLDEISQRAKKDLWYQQCLECVKQKEPIFLRIRDALAPEQRLELDAYIAACEELEHSLLPIAYQLGREN